MIAPGDVTGIVLAGGQGRRMGGVDKGLVAFRGAPMVAAVIERLAPQVGAIVVNANQNADAYAAFGHRCRARRRRRLRGAARGPARGARGGGDALRGHRAVRLAVPAARPRSRGSARPSTRTTPSSPSRARSTSRTRCSRSSARTSGRISKRSSREAAGRSTRGTRRCVSSRSRSTTRPTRSATSTRGRTLGRGRIVTLLAVETGGRDNNVLAIRYAAAASVILFHCYALTGRWLDEPLYAAFAPLNLGSLGVEVFFVLSGFLVTQSWLAHPSLKSFAMARVLRIYPALVAATVFTIVGRRRVERAGVGRLPRFAGDVALFRAHGVGHRRRRQAAGAFPDNPFPHAANGSLWTLPVELRLYVMLGLAGVLGLLARPRAWVVAALALVLAMVLWPDVVPLDPNTRGTRLAALLFLLGSLACVWQRYVPLSLPARRSRWPFR
jgi:hypothetical protein